MNVMIDIETLDNKPAAAILSIGLVVFDNEKIIDKLYIVPSVQDQLEMGRTTRESTLVWWMEQSKEAQKVFAEKKTSYKESLSMISTFLGKYGDGIRPWSNGATFDCVIMENAFDQAKIVTPWKYWNVRCFRTFCDLKGAKYKSSRSGDVSHNALQDALDQTAHMLKVGMK